MSRRLRWAVLLLSLVVVAAVVGFLAAVLVLVVIQVLLPPFEPGEADSLRKVLTTVIAYVAWGAAAFGTFVLGWRRIRRYRP